MKAVYYEQFGGPIRVETVPDPEPASEGVVIQVAATGLCRSDWHGWMGHDPDMRLPHVPGHELAGVVSAVGRDVRRWQVGDRVTVPFVSGCGHCPECLSGNHHVCDTQFQPGFTHWGSFADYVALEYADINLVRLPEWLGFDTAASLGCRFVTSFRAVVDQGKVTAGQWVAVHGCGGVGLSAIMIATALGAQVVGIDIDEAKLELARSLGAVATVNGATSADVVAEVRELTGGGAHVSLDALGNPSTCFNSIANLRKRGKHVQVGLLLGEQSRPALPMDLVLAYELEILGSHGMQAHRYPEMLAMIERGWLQPERLIGRRIGLSEAPAALQAMDSFATMGITIIEPAG
ncbi:MAG: zinc-dependent alcohol dehydrogenase family protein [Anaerolineales bacterium]|nr:zinc-dependent alcohol dehydrogenase family protein [Anaerolineales bacterium]MCB8959898.1 zinc-dependent alcohol dehydrogenase family protein [Ardenticatenales bacterium]